tara:strand:+ start:889 stop:1437 length:549 start_codon:yes stop_codon:yes gene_type:complete
MKFNKASMFGLDARIALAIFGALSVISGAALYSAIKEAKLTAIMVELKEFEKSVEQYMLDMGQDMPLLSAYNVDEGVLQASSASGWNGPYWGDLSKDYGILQIEMFTDDDNPSISGAIACKAGQPCYSWIQIASVNLTLADELDDKFDDGVRGTGDIRVWYSTPTSTTGLLGVKGPQTFKKY